MAAALAAAGLAGTAVPQAAAAVTPRSAPGQATRSVRPAPDQASWAIQKRYPLAAGQLSSVSCPTTSDCWTDGVTTGGAAKLLATTNGGQSWRPLTVPVTSPLEGISCPTVTDCWAVGGTLTAAKILASTDGGQHWTVQPVPAGTPLLYAVACAGTSDCWAVGGYDDDGAGIVLATTDCWAAGETSKDHGTVIATVNGGATWAAQTLPSDTFVQVTGIFCATTSECFAVGSAAVAATTNGGSAWTTQALPSGVGSLSAISCPTASACWATGRDSAGAPVVIATSDGGTTWTTQLTVSSPSSASFSSISCASASTCWSCGYRQQTRRVPGGHHRWRCQLDTGAGQEHDQPQRRVLHGHRRLLGDRRDQERQRHTPSAGLSSRARPAGGLPRPASMPMKVTPV
jgi:photosystem II stability/assembly factor-like uncharacterized protein